MFQSYLHSNTLWSHPSIIISFLSYMNTFINITFLLYQLHTFSIVSIIINHLLFSWWSEYTNAKQINGNTISFSWIIPIDNQDVHPSTCVCNQYNWYAVISTSVQFELESIHSLCSNPTKEQLVARSVLSYLLIVRIHMSIIAMLKVTWLLRISASDTDVMSKWILTWFIPSTTFMTWWRASSCCRGSSWLLNETLLRVFIIIIILWWNLSLWYAYYVRSSFMIPCSWYLTVTCLCWWVCLWGRCCKTYYPSNLPEIRVCVLHSSFYCGYSTSSFSSSDVHGYTLPSRGYCSWYCLCHYWNTNERNS